MTIYFIVYTLCVFYARQSKILGRVKTIPVLISYLPLLLLLFIQFSNVTSIVVIGLAHVVSCLALLKLTAVKKKVLPPRLFAEEASDFFQIEASTSYSIKELPDSYFYKKTPIEKAEPAKKAVLTNPIGLLKQRSRKTTPAQQQAIEPVEVIKAEQPAINTDAPAVDKPTSYAERRETALPA